MTVPIAAPDPGALVVSVRGDARSVVDPDSALLSASVTVFGASRAEAVALAGDRLRRVQGALVLLGGVPLRVENVRAPLTWSAPSTSTQPEHAADERTGQWGLTGRIEARVDLRVQVRDPGLLDGLGRVLAEQPDLDVHGVAWEVDEDNPEWPRVRAAAVRAAVVRATDYAAALGGRIAGIDHLADAGLIGRGEPGRYSSQSGAALSGGGGTGPSLDPVPQELVAVVEARFTAVGISLPQS